MPLFHRHFHLNSSRSYNASRQNRAICTQWITLLAFCVDYDPFPVLAISSRYPLKRLVVSQSSMLMGSSSKQFQILQKSVHFKWSCPRSHYIFFLLFCINLNNIFGCSAMQTKSPYESNKWPLFSSRCRRLLGLNPFRPKCGFWHSWSYNFNWLP